MEIGFIIGFILLISGIVTWRKSNDENVISVGFIFSYIGIWLFIIFGVLSLFKREIVPINLNILTGAIIGVITGIITGSLNLYFWMDEETFKKKQTPEEAIGGVGLGLFGAIFSIFIGIIIGALIGKFWG